MSSLIYDPTKVEPRYGNIIYVDGLDTLYMTCVACNNEEKTTIKEGDSGVHCDCCNLRYCSKCSNDIVFYACCECKLAKVCGKCSENRKVLCRPCKIYI